MRRLGYRTVDTLVDWLTDESRPPLRRASAGEMRNRLGGPAPAEPQDYEQILRRLFEDVLPYMSVTSHPRFFAFIPGAGTWPGALADLVASACNVYAGSWMESAGPSQVELEVLGWFKDWIGYPPDSSGVLVTGASAANLTALACAREAQVEGMRDDLVVYVGDQAHSSAARAARLLGFQPQQVRVLPTDESFRLAPRMLAGAIDADLAAGRTPLAAVLNAGGTNTGSVDPLPELVTVCRERAVWTHVDAAYGGFAVLSERGRKQLEGLELADSIALDPHKWLYQPYECGCLLVREGHALQSAFEMLPAYLHDSRTGADEVNFADLGLQLTRTSRALKLWVSLHAFGVDAFRTAIEHSLELAEHAAGRLKSDDRFELCAPPSLGVVCFRRTFADVDDDELELLNAGLVAALEQSGLGLVSSTRLRGRYAIRLCILNHSSTHDDVDRVLDFLATAEPLQIEQAATYERHPSVSASEAASEINSLPLFQLLDEAELARAIAPAKERLVSAGETVVERWETSRDFYVVRDGAAEVRIDSEVVGELGPGEFFGELAALEWEAGFSYPRLASVVAKTDLRLLVFPDGTLDDLLRDFPSVGAMIRAAATQRVARH